MNRKIQRWLTALCVVLAVAGAANRLRLISTPSHAAAQAVNSSLTNVAAQPRLARAYGQLPLSFELNRGQTAAPVKFLARGGGHTLFLTADEAVLRAGQAAPLRLKLLRANPATRISGVEELPAKSNYLIGADPRRHLTGVSHYARVRYENAWPGIELVWYGNKERQLEYDLLVAPGASLKAARLAISGARALTIDREGALVLSTEAGTVRMLKPVAWQEVEGKRVAVACSYRLNRRGEISFETGAYNRRYPLVIDPVLQYSTFLGGTGSETGTAIAVDAQGNTYITGQTGSVDFPGPSPLKGAKPANDNDAYVLKLNPSGSAIIYATWLGGSSSETANAIAVDAGGNAHVTGETFSTDFPKTTGALRESSAGGSDVYVVKLNPAGTALVYGTYLGGSSVDRGVGLAVDGGGNAWVAGSTDSFNFPVAGPAAGTTGSARSGSAVYKSSGGNNWSPSSTGLTTSSVTEFIADPGAANTFYTAGGVFKTTDGGNTWSRAGTLPQINGLSVGAFAFVIDPKTPTTFYLATSNGVYKSVNAGQSYELRSTGLQFPLINALAIDPVTPTTLYAASAFGVFKTTNGGDSWTLSNNGLSTGPNNTGQVYRVSRFAIDPLNPSTIYAGADRGVFKSTNGGGNWIGVNSGFTNAGQPGLGPNITALIVDPLNSTTLYAGVAAFNGSLYKSTNGGVTWQQSASGLSATFGTNTFPVGVNALALAASMPTTLYAATSSGVYKSTDGGANWAASNSGLAGVTVNTVFVDPRNATNVLAGANIGGDAFVSKLNATGTALAYSMYLGGTSGDTANGVAADANGNAWVVGTTASTNFPTLNPLRATNAGSSDIFVAKLNATGAGASGSALAYSTFLGGSFGDDGRGVALDAAGNVYLTGTTSSSDFPVVNALQNQLGGSLSLTDALVVKLKGDGSALLYSTYLGGGASDTGLGIAVDAGGNAWVTGSSGTIFTATTPFPAVGALQQEFGGGTTDAFIARLNASGARLLFSSLMGGLANDQGNGIAVDAAGNAYVTGTTNSMNFPTANPLQATLKSTFASDAFALKLALNADLALTLAESRDPVMVNNQLTYTATVTNNGPDNSGPIALTDTLPAGVTLVSATASQGTCSGTATVTCNLGELAAQERATVTLVITAATAGTLTNRASVSGTTSDAVQANNSASVETRVSAQPSIAGRITLGTSAGVGNVNVALGGAQTKTATTANDGFYQFADLTAGGNYTVTPERAGFVFNPPQRSFSNVTADQTGNFTAVACQFTIAPLNRTFPATGGIGSLVISSPDAQCPWTARSNVPWITVTSTTNGNGNGVVTFNVAATTAARSGTLTVAGNVFTVWQEANPCGVPDFLTPEYFAVAGFPSALISGDFNKDGKPDVAVGGQESRMFVLLNDGRGGFAPPLNHTSLGTPRQFVTADFNGDGALDLAAATGVLVVWLGKGDGTFEQFSNPAAGNNVTSLAVADFNGDGRADLVTANENSHNVSLLLGTGTGSFGALSNFGGIGSTTYVSWIVAGDLNGDNRADAAVISSEGLGLLTGNGQGGLNAPVRPTSFRPHTALIGDFNRDGRNDLVLGGNTIAILLANPDGTFKDPLNLPGSAAATWLGAGDLNNDGKTDLAAITVDTNIMLVFLGDGAGGFTPTGIRYASGRFLRGGAVNDFSGDGKADVLGFSTGQPDGNKLLILFLGDGAGGLLASRNYPSLFQPAQMLTRDFNNDGKLDVLVLGHVCLPAVSHTCSHRSGVELRLGDGNAGFGAPVSFLTGGGQPLAMSAGDFNGDGRVDVAAVGTGSDSVGILLNNGQGGFAEAAQIAVSADPRSIATGDFNGDRRTDLVVGHLTATVNQTLTVLLGTGGGSFAAPLTATLNTTFFSLVVTDLNNDGRADLVGSNYLSGGSTQNPNLGIYVMLGNGNGTFGPVRHFVPSVAFGQPVVGDFNGDGKLDLVATSAADTVALFLGDGTGNLAAPATFPLMKFGQFSSSYRELAVGDFNSDGRPDLAAANGDHDTVEILLGNGAGAFGGAVSFAAGYSPRSLAIGDYNGDGRQDLATLNYASNDFMVMLNNCVANSNAAAVSVSAADYSRTLATEAIAAVFGTALATSTQAATTLPLPTTLGGTTLIVRDSFGVERLAPLFFVSAGQINYQIPPGTAPGVATVTVRNGNGTVSAGTVQIESVAPGLFTANASGQGVAAGYVLRVKANGAQSVEPIAEFNAQTARFVPRLIDFGPESDQLFLILFGNGIRNRTSQFRVTVTVGGVDCEVLFAGAQGGFVGLDQLNLRLPRSLAGRGETDVVVKVEEKAANTVKVSFR
jgi:uncharacterized protein (TIGR03437 family)